MSNSLNYVNTIKLEIEDTTLMHISGAVLTYANNGYNVNIFFLVNA